MVTIITDMGVITEVMVVMEVMAVMVAMEIMVDTGDIMTEVTGDTVS